MLLVIMNPISGKGNSLNIYNSKLKNRLTDTEKEIILTKSKNHLEEYLKNNFDYIVYDRVLLIGGDGLINNYIQAAMHTKYLLKIPCSIIPTGSGNGIAKNLGIDNINLAIDKFFNGQKIKILRIQKVITDKNNIHFSVLYNTWGMVSDIDVETEFLRAIGNVRFYFGIAKFLFFRKELKGYLEYKKDEFGSIITKKGIFSFFCAGIQEWISSDFQMISLNKEDDKKINLIFIVDKPLSFFDRIKFLYYFLQNKHIEKCDFISHEQVTNYKIEEIDQINSSKMVCDGEPLNTKSICVNLSKYYIKFVI